MRKPFKKKFIDVKHPGDSAPDSAIPAPPQPLEADGLIETIPMLDSDSPRPPVMPKRSGVWKKAGVICGLIFLITLSFGAVRFWELKEKIGSSATQSLAIFQAALSDLRAFNFHTAQEKAGTGTTELRHLSDNLTPFQIFLTNKLGEGFIPLLKDIGQSYKDFQDISSSAYAMVERVKNLESLLPNALHGKDGDKVIADLEEIQKNLVLLSEASGRLVAASSKLKGILPIEPGDYLTLQLDLARARNLMDTLVPWLKSPEEHRIAILLGNPSEIRPGGGFSGSYAEVVLQSGAVKAIEVRDVSYADRELALKTIPPQPLQALVKNWRAADANWFFDFSQSAKKTIAFLEASDVYKNKGIKFDGAIAVSSRVVADLLALTGPIDASGVTITSENLLAEIQRQVQAGHDTGSTRSKQILADIAPILLERLATLSSNQYDELGTLGKEWILEKDVMLYAKDETFERFIDSYQAAGNLADLNGSWNGDYLAVVNANIGGGKTDTFINQKVVLQSQISNEGELSDRLVITRTHTAKADDPWWYRETNQDYLQIFTPSEAQLSFAEGGFTKKISAPLNYEKEGYVSDSDVAAIEATKWEHLATPGVVSLRQSGKNVFATWVRTARGATSEIVFEYSRKLSGKPQEGQPFQFIFEKQAAAKGEYEFEITAPVGFKFRENGLPVFEYKTDDPPARLILELTLEKI